MFTHLYSIITRRILRWQDFDLFTLACSNKSQKLYLWLRIYLYLPVTLFQTLFELLVQFYCDLFIQDPPQIDFADRLVPHLYELTQISPENAEEVVVSNMSDRQEEFAQICQKRAGRGLYPGLDTVKSLYYFL